MDRSKTPVGPFSDPGLLDLKAPLAVKVARGRVHEYHKDHPSTPADSLVEPRSPTKVKSGSSQYEVRVLGHLKLAIMPSYTDCYDVLIRHCCMRFCLALVLFIHLPISPVTRGWLAMSLLSDSFCKLECLGPYRCVLISILSSTPASHNSVTWHNPFGILRL